MITINNLLPNIEDYMYYQDNWVYFIEDFILLPKSKAEGLPFTLDEPQKEIIRSVNHNKRTTVVTGKGIGKTMVASCIALTFATLYTYPKIALSAPAGSQLETALWPEMVTWLRNSALEPLFEHTRDKVKYVPAPGSEWGIYRKTPKDDTCAAGLHKPDMLIICDEASGIREGSLAAFDGTLTDDSRNNNKILLISNGTRPDGFFFDTHTKKGTMEHWHQLQYSAFQSRFGNKKQIDYIRDRYGEDHPTYKVEVLGQFPDANSHSFISYADVVEAAGRWCDYETYCKINGKPTGPVEIGLDCAGDGTDLNVAIARHGDYVFIPSTLKHAKPKAIYNMVVEYANEVREITGFDDSIKVKIDTTGGYGTGPWEHIDDDTKNNLVAVKVNFAWKANNNTKFDSITSEMWDNVRYEMRNIVLYPDEFLKTELYTRKQVFPVNGKIKVEPKKDFKKEYHASPDRADALILAFADIKSDKTVAKEFDHNDKTVVRTIEYEGDERYGSIWAAKDSNLSCLYVGWDGSKLQVFGEYYSDDSISHLGMDVSRHTGLTKVIGNESMFNKRSNDDFKKRLRQFGVSLKENLKFDLLSATELLNVFIRSKKLVIDPRCYNLIEQMRDWKHDTKKSEMESKYGLCLALVNLVSFVNGKRIYNTDIDVPMMGSIDYPMDSVSFKKPNSGFMAC